MRNALPALIIALSAVPIGVLFLHASVLTDSCRVTSWESAVPVRASVKSATRLPASALSALATSDLQFQIVGAQMASSIMARRPAQSVRTNALPVTLQCALLVPVVGSTSLLASVHPGSSIAGIRNAIPVGASV